MQQRVLGNLSATLHLCEVGREGEDCCGGKGRGGMLLWQIAGGWVVEGYVMVVYIIGLK